MYEIWPTVLIEVLGKMWRRDVTFIESGTTKIHHKMMSFE